MEIGVLPKDMEIGVPPKDMERYEGVLPKDMDGFSTNMEGFFTKKWKEFFHLKAVLFDHKI